MPRIRPCFVIGAIEGRENEHAAVRYAVVTYENYDSGIMIPLAIILFRDPGIHKSKLPLIIVLQRLVDVCEGTPTDFVPVGNGGCLGGR